MEILTIRKPGRELHRHWRDKLKAQIVPESLRPSAMVNEAAARHGLKSNRLCTWRTTARQGKLVLPAPEFAAVIVDPPVSESPIKKASRPEIICSCEFSHVHLLSRAFIGRPRLRPIHIAFRRGNPKQAPSSFVPK
ncbi:transposase [Rhizobium sp. B21/90]|nr:transposase [Rhizobium sp. B21/90]